MIGGAEIEPRRGGTYTAPFAEIWDCVTSQIRSRKHWDLVYADEELGMFTVVCRSRFPRGADDLTVWVRLDEYGLTCLEVGSSHREGKTSDSARSRRIDELLRSVETAVGPGRLVRRTGDAS